MGEPVGPLAIGALAAGHFCRLGHGQGNLLGPAGAALGRRTVTNDATHKPRGRPRSEAAGPNAGTGLRLLVACVAAVALVPVSAQAASRVVLFPAAGRPQTDAGLNGLGFSAGARVLVKSESKTLASATAGRRGTFRVSVRVPRTSRKSLRIVSRSGRHRVVNVFRVSRRHIERPGGEVASERGARARWAPGSARVRARLAIRVGGFPPRRRLRVSMAGATTRGPRTNRNGAARIRMAVPVARAGRYRVRVRAGATSLSFPFTIESPSDGMPVPGLGRPTAPGPSASALIAIIESVTSATAHRYLTRDDLGNSMDTLKIIPGAAGGYLGVYHTLVGGVFMVKLATSRDLVMWTHAAELDAHGSQPTIAPLPGGGFVVAYEKDAGCTGTGPGGNCLRFQHYASLAALLAGTADRVFQAPRTLSKCAEGTPNVYAARLAPTIEQSSIDVGFHYFRDCDVDRQARGTLSDFSSWSARPDGELNTALEAFGPLGNIGDRDVIASDGGVFNVHEVQFTKGDFGSWRAYLYDWLTRQAVPLRIRTHRGSVAFANPTVTALAAPSGRLAVVVTLFIPSEGAAPGEGGELVYYRELPAP